MSSESVKRKAADVNGDDQKKQKVQNGEASASVDNDSDRNNFDLLEDKELLIPGPSHVGTLIICGGTNWDLVGRKAPLKGSKPSTVGKNLYSPHVFAPLQQTRVRLVVSGCNAAHTVVITEEGKALSWGRNEKGQLGTKDCVRKDTPTLIDGVEDKVFVHAAVGRNHTLLLTDRGIVYSCGDNKMGQCGINNGPPVITSPMLIKYSGPPIVKVGCGAEFSLILDCKGVLYSFGSPEYGQLGHGSTGEYIAQSNKVSYNTEKNPRKISVYVEKGRDNKATPVDTSEIIDFSCGTNHTVALDARKRVYSWGFGGYGRLGHADTKDELFPRLLMFFSTTGRGVKSVHCGSSYSLAATEHGMVYMCGLTKKSGEANMYPKPIRDLQGWKVRSIGCSNTSTVLAADETVIAFGPSPTYGELGLGDNLKSSPQPIEVKKLKGIYIEQVSCGLGHTVMIARDGTDEEKNKIRNLPVYTPSN